MPTTRHGHAYMDKLHGSPYQQEMIAVLNAPFRPPLVMLDGIDAFAVGQQSRDYRDRVAAILSQE